MPKGPRKFTFVAKSDTGPDTGRGGVNAAKKGVRSGRGLTIGLGSIVSVLVLIGLLACWGVGMTLMLLFGDRLSERLIVQNSEMQEAYEQRLQAYRAEIARVVQEMEQSRFDQNSVEGHVVELGRRQRLIESRLQALNRLSDLIAPGVAGAATDQLTSRPAGVPEPPERTLPRGTDSPAAPTLSGPSAKGVNKIAFRPSETMSGEARIDLIQSAGPPTVEQGLSPSVLDAFIERMDKSLTRAEQRELQALDTMVRVSGGRAAGFDAALREIGMSPDDVLQSKLRNEPSIAAVVLPISDQETPFGQRLRQVQRSIGLMHRMRFFVESLPISKPTLAEVRYSSGFGYRKHPILGYMKLHAGIDMASPIGTPVRAAGSGVVVGAGWGGGYGNLIQIDHGNGLISRYAHLSEMDVTTGQPIASGAFIGKVGTTGASTGAHLHFETRINGTPYNPACFMLAGDKVTGHQTMPLPCDSRPVWKKQDKQEDEDDDS